MSDVGMDMLFEAPVDHAERERWSALVRAMARRTAAVRAEHREILANHSEAWRAMADRVDELEHARHRRWRRWPVTGWVLGKAYTLGLVAGYGHQYGPRCHGCLTGVSWRGRRPYLLGLLREEWSCLRAGHRRREIPEARICAVCAPCWVCRSTDPEHDAWLCEQRKTEPAHPGASDA